MGRIAWIDVLRGLGILAVVAGHTFATGAFKLALYWFHMPLFFFISGFVYAQGPSFSHYAWRRIRQLLLPLTVWLLVMVATACVYRLSTSHRPFLSVLKEALHGSLLSDSLTTYWFVPCLLFSLIIYDAIHRWASRKASVISTVLYGAGMVYPTLSGQIHVPSVFVSILFAIPCIHIGVLARKNGWASNKAINITAISIFVAAFMTVLVTGARFNVVDLKAESYGMPLLNVAVAFGAISLLARISMYANPFAPTLSFLGRASLLILLTHQLIQSLAHSLGIHGELVRFVLAVTLPCALFVPLSSKPVIAEFCLGVLPKEPRTSDPNPREGSKAI